MSASTGSGHAVYRGYGREVPTQPMPLVVRRSPFSAADIARERHQLRPRARQAACRAETAGRAVRSRL